MIRRDIYLNREYRGHEMGLAIYHKNIYSYVSMSRHFFSNGNPPVEMPTLKNSYSYYRNPVNAAVLKKRKVA